MIAPNNMEDTRDQVWYPFHPRAKLFFRLIGVLYVVGVVLTIFIEQRFSIVGCLLAAMFFAWDTEKAPKTLRNRFGIMFHWIIGTFFLCLGLMSIWLLFFPI